MAKWVLDKVMEQGLHYIGASCDIIGVCKGQPSSYASAFNTNGGGGDQCMASRSTIASADYTIGDGDVSGRKITLSKRAGLTITNNGTADHIALGCTGSSLLILITTCTQQVLTSGGTVDINAFDDEILDAA